MPARFAHLHVHTDYSLLDGACKVDKPGSEKSRLLEAVKSRGMDSLAITDHGVMYGVLPFYRSCLGSGVKPIIGLEAYIAPGGRLNRDGGPEETRHLVLLAMDNEGYRNLLQLATTAFVDGFYYKPRIDMELLEKHRGGLIAMSACLKGEIAQFLLRGEEDAADEAAERYARVFGDDNFYIELMDHGIPEQEAVNPMLVDLARRKGLGLVATNDAHYISREDAAAHDALLCIQTKSLLSEENRLKFSTEEFYLKTPDEMASVFPDYPEALANSVDIAERCNVEIDLDQLHLPRYEPPSGFDLDSYLEHLARTGLKDRYDDAPTAEASERLEYELSVIKKLGFSGYFLIVWDFIKHAKDIGIRVGPGRGSAAGSLVAYTLGITTIDPLKYGLLFERFLNEERIALPDIDVDIGHFRRQEVIDYVAEKYGRDRVAQIVTFSTFNARQAVKDIGRVMDIPYQRMEELTKMVPEKPGMTIDKALAESSDLMGQFDSDPEARKCIESARAIEGMVRHQSVHAAAVVIADDVISAYSPLCLQQRAGETGSVVTTQYDMYDVEKLGLLKVDMLGLKNQSLIELAVRLIEERTGRVLDIDNLPMDDAKTFALIQSGRTIGTFQLSSPGMRGLMRDLVPTRFEDIIALIALYRPGPMGLNMHKAYVDQKHGRQKVSYPHPSLEGVLSETFGVIVYQEQVMRIAQVLAGYSGQEADELRKAMAKKKREIMDRHRVMFFDGAREKGIDEKTTQTVFELIDKFGEYGFNKSHSTAYAYISYQTAYLKAHYPSEYMAALMTVYMTDQDRLVEYINECRSLGIDLKLPDINRSRADFTPFDNHILFGLSAVRNVGSTAVEALIEERDRGGHYSSFLDFCDRVPSNVANKRTLESLIKAGAFDVMEDRSRLMLTYETSLSTAQRRRREREEGQFSLFDDGNGGEQLVEESVTFELEPVEGGRLLAFEKEMLGVYVSDHPLTEYKQALYENTDLEIASLTSELDRQQLNIGGMIAGTNVKPNKQGKTWATFKLEDFSGTIEVLLFSNKYEKFKEIVADDQIVMVKGRLDAKDETRKFLADEVRRLPVEGMTPEYLAIRIDLARFHEGLAELIKKTLQEHPGTIPVRISLVSEGREAKRVKTGDFYSVDTSGDLIAKLKSLLGENSVRVMYPEG